MHATGRFFFTTNYQYLCSYKGLAFYTKSPEPLVSAQRVRGRQCPQYLDTRVTRSEPG